MCLIQVRFGILEAGAYGVSQSRKRAFIWAAAPGEILPEWPEPMHVFAAPELKIALSQNSHYAAVRSTAGGAPFRAITVRDTIGDLPEVGNGASRTTIEVTKTKNICHRFLLYLIDFCGPMIRFLFLFFCGGYCKTVQNRPSLMVPAESKREYGSFD